MILYEFRMGRLMAVAGYNPSHDQYVEASDVKAIQDLADRLYRTLRAQPCGCCKSWQDGKPEMQTVKLCQRCIMLERYEVETGQAGAVS